MKTLIRKLRQRTGASMLLALTFMMLCVFIGGSVLAAATANNARLQRLTEEDQEYLTLRSAAALIVDELRPLTRSGTQMAVLLNATEEFSNVEGAEPTVKKTVTYALTDNRNELRELAYLCAACQYRSVYDLTANETDFSDFTRYGKDPYFVTPALTGNGSGQAQSEFTVTLTLDGDDYPLTACMICDGDYDISVFFLTEDGEFNDRLHIEMNTSYLDDSDQMLDVIWEAPVIVKGGA